MRIDERKRLRAFREDRCEHTCNNVYSRALVNLDLGEATPQSQSLDKELVTCRIATSSSLRVALPAFDVSSLPRARQPVSSIVYADVIEVTQKQRSILGFVK